MRTLRFALVGFFSLFAIIFILAPLANAAIIRVKTNGNDTSSGDSWVNAKKTVQAAINADIPGEEENREIWVAAGTYAEHIKNKTAGPAGSEVAVDMELYGGFAGIETERNQRNWSTNLTILDGGGATSPTVNGSVIIIDSSATQATRIDGFVITGGHGIAAGGILISGSGPVIANNIIAGNLTNAGGGILVLNYKITPPQVHPVITNNTIVENYAIEGGGGIAIYGSERINVYDPVSPVISRNNMSRNISELHGGGIAIYGHAAPQITNNFILANTAAYAEENFIGNGGGIYATSRGLSDEPLQFTVCAPVMTSNIIAANGANFGGGIHLWDTDVDHGGVPVVTNNTLVGNSGTGISWITTYPIIQNNLIAYNSRGLEQGDFQSSPSALRNNCLYGNQIWEEDTNYNGFADQTGINGNISADPKMANYKIGNFHLQASSPCIDAGYSAAIGNVWTDIDGQARIIGNGVDIGADESDGQFSPAPTPIYYVRPSGNDGQNGLNWGAAKKTVAAAITAARNTGGEIWVAAGTYVERNILPAFIYLYGGFAGTETDREARNIGANPTILDGGGGLPTVVNSLWAGYFLSAIDGFTIQNGGLYTGGSVPTGTQGYKGRGGGIYCQVTSPLIQNNIIRHNSLGNPFDSPNKTGYGAGIYTYLSYALIQNNTVTENEVINNNADTGRGGGIYFYRSMPSILRNTITNNRAISGAGIYGVNAYPRIIGNTIENNSFYTGMPGYYMGASEGALTLDMCWNFVIERNLIKGNTAAATGGSGAGINLKTNFAGRIQNNLIVNNNANGGGGGIYAVVPTAATDSLYIVNNTIVGNTGSSYGQESGGGLALSILAPIFTPPDPIPNRVIMANNIIAFNSSGIYLPPTGVVPPNLVKNDVYNPGSNLNYINFPTDPPPGPTDIHIDPGFVNRTGGDFRLTPTSLCIDAGENASIPAGLTTDYAGNPRIVDGNRNGVAVVDMGAYELTFSIKNDFNRDSKPDILWRNTGTGANAIWYMDGVNLVGIADLPALPSTSYALVGVGDFNGDTKPDILWRNTATGANAIWYMDGVNLVGIADLPALPSTSYALVGVGDFNGDSKPDILWRNTATGANAIWYMDGVNLIGIADLPALPSLSYALVGVGDFNGDSKPDILWRNTGTGANAVWYMDGVNLIGIADLPALPSLSYALVGVGDFNGDSKPDILWRNTGTGANAVWYMDGVNLIGIADLPALPNPDYAIVGR